MNILVALQQLGYEVQVDGDALWLRWRRAEEPPWEQAVPLLKEAQRRKTEILATLVRSQVPATGGDAPVRPRPQRSQRAAGASRRGSPLLTPPVPEQPTSEIARIDTQANTINTPASPDDEDADKPIGVLASTVQDPMRPGNQTRCGWCGSAQLWLADTGSGRIYCETCHGVYHPSQAEWSPGDSAKRQVAGTPPTACSTEELQSDTGQGHRGRLQRLTEKRLGTETPDQDVLARQAPLATPAHRAKVTRPSRRRQGPPSTTVNRRRSLPHRAQKAGKHTP